MADMVECLSGSAYGERPVAFIWQGQRLEVSAVLSQGRTPQAKWFRVRAADGQVFELSFTDAAGKDPSVPAWNIIPI
jgi:hypothetical protein